MSIYCARTKIASNEIQDVKDTTNTINPRRHCLVSIKPAVCCAALRLRGTAIAEYSPSFTIFWSPSLVRNPSSSSSCSLSERLVRLSA